MVRQSLSIKLVTQKVFSQNMEIHKRKIPLNSKNWRCILHTNKNSLKILQRKNEYSSIQYVLEIEKVSTSSFFVDYIMMITFKTIDHTINLRS